MEDFQQLRMQLAHKNRQLQQIAAQLKTELFGIDAIIDRVIDSVRAWYLLPELVTRPVIVCLWGLTGTGKTQLVRRLARLPSRRRRSPGTCGLAALLEPPRGQAGLARPWERLTAAAARPADCARTPLRCVPCRPGACHRSSPARPAPR